MDHYKNAVLAISEIQDEKQVVQLFELLLSKITIGTIQQMANLEGKSYNGVKNSTRYCKISIGGKKLVVKGVDDSKLPF